MIGLKKNLGTAEARRLRVDPEHPTICIARQCELLGVTRSTYYLAPRGESEENLNLMHRLDEQYTHTPFYGSRRMAVVLGVNRKRMSRLMRLMGLVAIYPGPRTTIPSPSHKIYPYLLRGIPIKRVNHVWSADITYIRMARGFVYLVAVIDWFSRYVLSWELSTTLDSSFCLAALERALMRGRPDIFNTDQGSQFTSNDFTGRLLDANVAISMDGRGRALDNVFVERLWRTVKYEEVYIKSYDTVPEALHGLRRYFNFYNTERPHQSLGYCTPGSIFGFSNN